MTGTLGRLVSFAGAPTGSYKGFCLPHVAMGMKLAITVQ